MCPAARPLLAAWTLSCCALAVAFYTGGGVGALSLGFHGRLIVFVMCEGCDDIRLPDKLLYSCVYIF